MNKETLRDDINRALRVNFQELKEALEQKDEYNELLDIFLDSFNNTKRKISSLIDDAN